MKRIVDMILLVVAFTFSPISSAGGRVWPVVQALHMSYRIQEPFKAVVKAVIRATSGNELYLFVCRTGDDDSVPDVNYAGDLDCRLMEATGGERETNLLVETHAPNLAPWYSRGRMFAYELYADCANYPEYGRLRHFRLRSMLLTMSFDAVRFVPAHGGESPRLASYTLNLVIDPDPSALRDIAESSGYLDPNVTRPGQTRSCSIIQKGNEWGDE